MDLTLPKMCFNCTQEDSGLVFSHSNSGLPFEWERSCCIICSPRGVLNILSRDSFPCEVYVCLVELYGIFLKCAINMSSGVLTNWLMSVMDPGRADAYLDTFDLRIF